MNSLAVTPAAPVAQRPSTPRRLAPWVWLPLVAVIVACTSEAPARPEPRPAASVGGAVLTVHDTLIRAGLDVAGVAEPMQQATVSTKLMGTVTQVLVREGDVVRRGQVLLTLDARELSARASQVSAAIESATAMQVEAAAQAARIRALYADSAATRAQLDAVTAGLARADAGVQAAQASASELDAVRSYATVRAPFDGVVTARMVDAGAFAAPGAPLITVQDVSSLRLSVAAAADAVKGLHRGMVLDATIDGAMVRATIEGVVPTASGNLFTVNATVRNREGAHRAGSAATLRLAGGDRSALLIPSSAIVREGDLTGVRVRGPDGDSLRWVRLGMPRGEWIEVTGGLRAGESIVLSPASAAGA